MTKSHKWAKAIFIIVCILSAVFLAYHDALNNQLITTWDTQAYVIDNTHIRAFNWENIYWMFTNFDMANWHPLTWVSHALDYALFGLEPWGHHFVSILIHAFNTILFFGLVIVLMSFKTRDIDNQTLLAAGVAALLFGIHPQHVESVVWIAERKDVLCLFFILLTLLSYVFYTAALGIKRYFWYFSTLLCFGLALLSKPMAVTVPVILLLMDVYPLNRTRLTHSPHAVSYIKLILEKIPFFLFTLFTIMFTLMAQQEAMFAIDRMGIIFRILNACNTLILYIAKFIFPVALSPFYPLIQANNTLEYYSILIPITATILITILCTYLWYKKKYYALITWLFYLVTLSPVIGIIQVGSQSAADRYVYLPTMPFYILLGIGFVKLLYTKKIGKQIKLASIIMLVCLSLLLIQLTQTQGKVWKNDITLWSYASAYNPENGSLHYSLAHAYSKNGAYEKALVHYNRAIAIEPTRSGWYPTLLKTYLLLEQFDKALNLIETPIEEGIDIGLPLDQLYFIQGWIYHKQGLLHKAQEALSKSLTINPDRQHAQEFMLKINKPEVP